MKMKILTLSKNRLEINHNQYKDEHAYNTAQMLAIALRSGDVKDPQLKDALERRFNLK